MNHYKWDYKNYRFDLKIGKESQRWDGEGVIQKVYLSVNNYPLIDNSWGIEHNYNTFDISDKWKTVAGSDVGLLTLNIGKKSMKFRINDYDFDVIEDKDYIQFIKWIKSHLSPVVQQRTIKIDKIIKRKREY